MKDFEQKIIYEYEWLETRERNILLRNDIGLADMLIIKTKELKQFRNCGNGLSRSIYLKIQQHKEEIEKNLKQVTKKYEGIKNSESYRKREIRKHINKIRELHDMGEISNRDFNFIYKWILK